MMNSLDLLILFQPIRSQFSSNTTLLEPAKRYPIMSHHVVITPNRTRIYRCRYSQSLGVVGCEDTSA